MKQTKPNPLMRSSVEESKRPTMDKLNQSAPLIVPPGSQVRVADIRHTPMQQGGPSKPRVVEPPALAKLPHIAGQMPAQQSQPAQTTPTVATRSTESKAQLKGGLLAQEKKHGHRKAKKK
jgi:hypothetical protein